VGGCFVTDRTDRAELAQLALAFEQKAIEVARCYIDRFACSKEGIESLKAFDPELARAVRELTAASIAHQFFRQGGR
jgi:hypothetical protein